jgi:hypothetical protein
MNLSMNVCHVTHPVLNVKLVNPVPVVMTVISYITDNVLEPVHLVTMLNLTYVTAVKLVILIVKLVTLVMLTVVILAH